MTRRFLPPAALALAAAALFGACKATDTAGNMSAATAAAAKSARPPAAATGTTQVDADGARRVSVAELQKMLGEGRAAVYDTRAKAAYEQEHIKGALSMPSNEVGERAAELPRDKTLVFYCT